jgi:hypothetical protein
MGSLIPFGSSDVAITEPTLATLSRPAWNLRATPSTLALWSVRHCRERSRPQGNNRPKGLLESSKEEACVDSSPHRDPLSDTDDEESLASEWDIVLAVRASQRAHDRTTLNQEALHRRHRLFMSCLGTWLVWRMGKKAYLHIYNGIGIVTPRRHGIPRMKLAAGLVAASGVILSSHP